MTPPVLEQLRNEHPSRPDGGPPPDFTGRPAGDLSPKERDLMDEVGKQYRQAITTASKGSAPGIWGWRYEHFFQCLLEPSTGPRPVEDGIMQHIYAFFDRILIGDLEDRCRDLLRFGKGFALAKPNGGVRPITVTDTFHLLLAQESGSFHQVPDCSMVLLSRTQPVCCWYQGWKREARALHQCLPQLRGGSNLQRPPPRRLC
mmetsp:Transcript_24972/g.56644  ORF Transcript_24972/g.56644 Transcript_24972/m.56644 type:complete len:202 (-) Transcript_24972:752-1357(-)